MSAIPSTTSRRAGAEPAERRPSFCRPTAWIMIASSLGAGYPAAAGNWADDRSMSGPEYAQSKAICSSLKGLSLPPADRPDGLRQRRSRDGAPRRSNSGSVLSPDPVRARKYMSENHLPRRPGYGRDTSARPYPDDRERMARARQAAEALFTPTPPVTEKLSVDQPARQPRVLETAPPPARREAIKVAAVSPEPRMPLPPAHFARIRSWVKYGMTLAQVAEVYKVPVGEIARICGKS